MKILLIPIGSAGDVYPFLGMALELRRRGHEPTILTNGYFEPVVRQMGFGFLPFGTRDDYLAAIRNVDIWHPTRGFRTVTSFITRQRSLYDDIVRQRDAGGAQLVVAHSLAFAARVAQDKLGVPVVSVHPAPALIRSQYEMPVMKGRVDLSRWPRWTKRAFWWAADRVVIDPLIGPMINDLRRSVGLPPVHRFFHGWLHSPLLTLGLFPEWYAPPQPDWPPQVRLTGFPLFDAPGMGGELPAEVEQFLNSPGGPPIVATPGSANLHAREFFVTITEACARLNRRGILLTRFAEQLPDDLPPDVRHFDYAPLSQLLPRSASLIHHGGIGTTAAGLAGGVPQVIMPMSHDQPDNAHRIVRLGVGERLMPRQFHVSNLTRALTGLLESGEVRQRCRELAGRCRQTDGSARACDLIESVAPIAESHESVRHRDRCRRDTVFDPEALFEPEPQSRGQTRREAQR